MGLARSLQSALQHITCCRPVYAYNRPLLCYRSALGSHIPLTQSLRATSARSVWEYWVKEKVLHDILNTVRLKVGMVKGPVRHTCTQQG